MRSTLGNDLGSKRASSHGGSHPSRIPAVDGRAAATACAAFATLIVASCGTAGATGPSAPSSVSASALHPTQSAASTTSSSPTSNPPPKSATSHSTRVQRKTTIRHNPISQNSEPQPEPETDSPQADDPTLPTLPNEIPGVTSLPTPGEDPPPIQQVPRAQTGVKIPGQLANEVPGLQANHCQEGGHCNTIDTAATTPGHPATHH